MTRTIRRTCLTLLAGGTTLAAACSDPTGSNLETQAAANAALLASLATAPVGYGDLSTSYVGAAAAGVSDASVWLGGGRDARFGGGAMGGALMGGGIQDAFVGGVGRGRGFGHEGPFGGGLGCAGSFNATTGRVSCTGETRNGLTVTRSAAYTNTAGAVQQAFDSATTNTVNVKTEVSGTVAYTRPADDSTVARTGDRRGGRGGRHGWGDGRGPGGRLLGDTATILTASTTIQSTSDRTTSGLAQGSTERKVDGATGGQESTTGTSSRGAFTATRAVGDTTRGLVIPVAASGTPTYPTAGTVIRAMRATLTYTGQATATVARREVVTYDGSATARVVITQNDSTRTCTRPLPRGPLSCQ